LTRFKDIVAWAEGEEFLEPQADGQQSTDARDVPKSTVRNNQATVLVKLALDEGVELWHDPDQRPWITIPVQGHEEHWLLASGTFRRWLKGQYFNVEAKTPNTQALQDALGVLEGQAQFNGLEYPVYTRLADHDAAIYLDLGNAEWQAIEVTPTSWRVVAIPPVKFRRSRGMLSLPCPVSGGTLAELRPFVNVTGPGWVLLVSWLIAALRPVGPYPILALHGEQGSAKSTTSRVLRALIDPNAASLRADPRDGRDLMIAATNGWVVALDNLSHLAPWLSDALCRLATGGGFATRELYTDAEEAIFDAQRPIILNGIQELATRGDLLDRSIFEYLPSIPDENRRTEGEFWSDFEEARPRILGALLDAVSYALAHIDEVHLERLPRMADFAKWATAAEPALGLEPGEFMAAYSVNRKSANDLILEGSPVAPPLRALADKEHWEGTAAELLSKLEKLVDESTRKLRAWPKTPLTLSNSLRRLAPNLRAGGMVVEFSTPHGKRLVTIRKVEEFSVPSVPAFHPDTEEAGSGTQTTPDGTQGERKDIPVNVSSQIRRNARNDGNAKKQDYSKSLWTSDL